MQINEIAAPRSDTAAKEMMVSGQPDDSATKPMVTPESAAPAYEQALRIPETLAVFPSLL